VSKSKKIIIKKLAKKKKSCQEIVKKEKNVVRKLSTSFQKVVKKMQKVAKKCQKVIKKVVSKPSEDSFAVGRRQKCDVMCRLMIYYYLLRV
jgi:hypothetical protein